MAEDSIDTTVPAPTSAVDGPIAPAGGVLPHSFSAAPTPIFGSQASAAPVAAPRRHGRALAVVAVILGVALLATLGVAAWLFVQLYRANERIDQQRDLIDRKEAFAEAVQDLETRIEPMSGLPFASIVPWDRYERLVARGWEDRWNAEAMDADIRLVERAEQELRDLQSAAALEIATNASGTAWEAILDELGQGYVATRIDDAATTCASETALGCVVEDEPFVVHLSADSASDPTMTDWIRTGVAYHEFAHVLQFTNPDATDAAMRAFGGDMETMADCYALTFLEGWTLDHVVWTSPDEAWDISIGYGYACDDAQRQVMRDWHAELGVESRDLRTGPA